MATYEDLNYVREYPIFTLIHLIYVAGSTCNYVVEDLKAIMMYRGLGQGIEEIAQIFQNNFYMVYFT